MKPLLASEIADLPSITGQKYRSKQLADWLYKKAAPNFAAMSDLPKAWRNELAQQYVVDPFINSEPFLSRDGSVRYLFTLSDGKKTEAVYMPYKKRKTLCISTMVGCPAGCTFCATGALGFGRNLTVAEILGQVISVARQQTIAPTEIRNVVFMGMGEALLNYENSLTAIRRMLQPEGFNMSPRRITLSTVGLPKKIKRLAVENLPLVLALSLHAPDEETRHSIIPTAHAHSIADIMAALKVWQEKVNRRITIEYTMLAGVNDHLWQAKKLVTCLKGLGVHINLIPFNSWLGSSYQTSSTKQIATFQKALEQANLSVSVRFSRGRDVGAACGQLALNNSTARNDSKK